MEKTFFIFFIFLVTHERKNGQIRKRVAMRMGILETDDDKEGGGNDKIGNYEIIIDRASLPIS